LALKPLEAYRRNLREERAEVARHRTHIALEEEQARSYRAIYVQADSEDRRVNSESSTQTIETT
jgi:hypothetical protein